jgi:hypothetical protein
MKVLNLVIESVKRIKNVVITPSGWAVKIAGKNAQGKTSILDALEFLIEGERNIPEGALRFGAEKGIIEADFGDFRAKRSISAKGSTLVIEDKDGKVQKAQSFLNDLLGGNATDVMSFMQRPAAKQREILAKLVGVDTSSIDKEIDSVYSERTKIGHEIERLQGVMRSTKWTEGKGIEEEKADDLRNELDKTLEHNQSIKKAQREKDDIQSDLDRIKKQIEKLKADLSAKEGELAEVEMKLVGEELLDETELFHKIKNIDNDNMIRRENKKYAETRNALRTQERISEEKTTKIEELRKKKTDAIAAAKFPIEGLSLGSGEVLLNGRPLSEASGAEQIMVGIAILSKMIPADGIRILRCNNGSLIDAGNMAEIETLAEREKVQIWIEIVMNSPEAGDGSEIFIEDGQVKK